MLRVPRQGAMASPADGIVVAAGPIARTTRLRVQGVDVALPQLLGPHVDLAAYLGGRYVTTQLTAYGDPRVRMPATATLTALPSARADRRLLHCRCADAREFVLVLVGVASDLVELPRTLARNDALARLGRGGAVVLLTPPALSGHPPAVGSILRVDQPLW